MPSDAAIALNLSQQSCHSYASLLYYDQGAPARVSFDFDGTGFKKSPDQGYSEDQPTDYIFLMPVSAAAAEAFTAEANRYHQAKKWPYRYSIDETLIGTTDQAFKKSYGCNMEITYTNCTHFPAEILLPEVCGIEVRQLWQPPIKRTYQLADFIGRLDDQMPAGRLGPASEVEVIASQNGSPVHDPFHVRRYELADGRFGYLVSTGFSYLDDDFIHHLRIRDGGREGPILELLRQSAPLDRAAQR